MHINLKIYTQTVVLTVLLFSTCCCSGAGAATTDAIPVNKLDGKFQRISNEFYSYLSRQSKFRNKTFTSMKVLENYIEQLKSSKQYIPAIANIRRNIGLIKNNFDHESVSGMLSLLLSRNETHTAEEIHRTIQTEGDKALVSNISFIFAKHYIKERNWKKTIATLDGTISDLPLEDAHLALLMQGISLQHLKRHRDAIKIYKKIPETSRYYALAVLNSAVAYIRQDWWTDAHLAISNLLKNKKATISDELTNRLYTVIGYSLLRKEFYRDSREAFRNVEINSRYSNKAMLGIALTATNQDDYFSALNALTILSQKKSHDLSVDESHLLLPYIYEKLRQNVTASTGYTDAILYYRNRISDTNRTLTSLKKRTNPKSVLHSENITHLVHSHDYIDKYPVSFLDNFKELEQFVNYLNNNVTTPDLELKREINNFYQAYSHRFTLEMEAIIQLRIRYLRSYMSQSRYGLARLYDKSNPSSD